MLNCRVKMKAGVAKYLRATDLDESVLLYDILHGPVHASTALKLIIKASAGNDHYRSPKPSAFLKRWNNKHEALNVELAEEYLLSCPERYKHRIQDLVAAYIVLHGDYSIKYVANFFNTNTKLVSLARRMLVMYEN